MEFQCSRLEENDAILLLFGVNWRCVGAFSTCQELLLEHVCEELTHALLVALIFEIHIRHEALWLRVTVGALEQHPQVCDRAYVVFSYINDEARVCFLLNCDFASFFLWADLDAWLCDLNLLLVQVRSHLDRGITLFS